MDIHFEITIKVECEDVEDILDYGFDAQGKVENGHTYGLDYIQEGDIIKSQELYTITKCYKDLIQDSKQTCFLCRKFFPNSFSLLQHNLEHFQVPLIRQKLLMCDQCPKYYRNKRELELHIITVHTSINVERTSEITQPLLTCTICYKAMNYKRWHGHMREVHAKQKMKCEICHVEFKCKRYLKRHTLYVHEGLRPDWRFYRKPLKQIGNIYKCSVCPAVLRSSSALLSHNTCYHIDQKYQCHICKKIFKCKAYLSTHLKRVHSNDGKVHICDVCEKTFKSQHYLNRHKKKNHKLIISVSKSSHKQPIDKVEE